MENYKIKTFLTIIENKPVFEEIETPFPKDLAEIYRDFATFLEVQSNGKYNCSPLIINKGNKGKLLMNIFKKEDGITIKTNFYIGLIKMEN